MQSSFTQIFGPKILEKTSITKVLIKKYVAIKILSTSGFCFNSIITNSLYPKNQRLPLPNKTKKIKAYESWECEKKAEFPGGEQNFLKYVAEHSRFMETPEDLQSSFCAKFIIDTSGKVQNICILRPQDPDGLTKSEKEFLMSLVNMPIWIPAEKKGKKVPVWIIIPLKINWQ